MTEDIRGRRVSGAVRGGALALVAVLLGIAAGCGGTTKTATTTGGGGLATSAPATSSSSGAAGGTGGTIKIGVLTDLQGPFAIIGDDSVRGAKLAVSEMGGQVAGKKIELVVESGDATPDTAVAKAKKLLDQDKVDFIVGPLSGDEGLAIKGLAKQTPDQMFVNGSSAAQDLTLRDPAPNMFRFSTDGAQWMAGLGTYIYDKLGYRRIATVAEDYSYPYTQVGGLLDEFCPKGGHVVKKAWVPVGTKDFGSVISGLPKDIDAVYVALGGSDSVNFLKQATQFGLKVKLIGGTSTVDQNVLASKGDLAKSVTGVPAAGPVAADDPSPEWKQFTDSYKQQFPDGLATPSLFAEAYYVEMKGALLALKAVNGDLSNGQKAFGEALAKVSFDSPTGPIKLDENRNAIASNFVTQVKSVGGSLQNLTVEKKDQVSQTFGMPLAEYVKRPPYDRDHPACP